MAWHLGIDTSNYVTSAALYDPVSGKLLKEQIPLPVPENQGGLRQSDALFAHVKQLGTVMDRLFFGRRVSLSSVSASIKPRNNEDSYMPCFLAGKMAAEAVAVSHRISLYPFSHQQGHIAAALYSAGRLDLLKTGDFYAFHVSGGTTDCLLVKPSGDPLSDISLLSTSLDLHAGQAVDRVGLGMGLTFPCGPAIEALALKCGESISVNIAMKDGNVCLSGLENQCARLYREGRSREYAAMYCLQGILAAVDNMLKAAIKKHGKKPVVFAGGVMSNTIIRAYFEKTYEDVFFSEPSFSCDNAAGIAVLGACVSI